MSLHPHKLRVFGQSRTGLPRRHRAMCNPYTSNTMYATDPFRRPLFQRVRLNQGSFVFSHQNCVIRIMPTCDRIDQTNPSAEPSGDRVGIMNTKSKSQTPKMRQASDAAEEVRSPRESRMAGSGRIRCKLGLIGIQLRTTTPQDHL